MLRQRFFGRAPIRPATPLNEQPNKLMSLIMSEGFALQALGIPSPVGLAPMAGYTDLPFRQICLEHGAGFAVAEMVSANPALRGTGKSTSRLTFAAAENPRIAQIAGSDPDWCAEAARYAVAAGAEVVDINMGCPVKKVCNTLAGSALLRDLPRVERILRAVVGAVEEPVTLKTRLGWDRESINIPLVARLAEDAGIRWIAIHARTRACRFKGAVDYAPIARVTESVSIPVLVNGDLKSAEDVERVCALTGAAGALIGRAAVGNPWIFGAVRARLQGTAWRAPTLTERLATLRGHVAALHAFYGDDRGLRFARKHTSAYLEHGGLPRAETQGFMTLADPLAQLDYIDRLVDCAARGLQADTMPGPLDRSGRARPADLEAARKLGADAAPANGSAAREAA